MRAVRPCSPAWCIAVGAHWVMLPVAKCCLRWLFSSLAPGHVGCLTAGVRVAPALEPAGVLLQVCQLLTPSQYRVSEPRAGAQPLLHLTRAEGLVAAW